jgi:VanZ family protein
MRYAPLFVYASALAWFSLTPVEQYGIDVWDKLMHFFVYAVFVAIAYVATKTRKKLVLLTCGIIAYGALMEVLQSFVPGRQMSAADGLANSLGALTALLLINLLINLSFRGFSKRQ